MSANDNSVNIKKKPKQYHHGNLRAALVKAGLDLLKDRAADDLSLREVARHVGVSATAVYRHFPDKQALLVALSNAGAEELGRVQTVAANDAGGGRAGFEASGRAYILFALANPGLFRLIMSTRPEEDYFSAKGSRLSSAMQLLRGQVAEMLPANASELDHKVMALHAWSLVHGMSMLMLDGIIPPERDVVDEIVSMAARRPKKTG